MVLGSWQVFALPLLAISHRCYLIPLMGINVLKMKMKNKMCTRNASLLLFLSGAKQCINKQKGEPNQAKFVIMNVLFSEKGRWTSITFFCYSESAYRLWQQRKFKKDSHIPQIISPYHKAVWLKFLLYIKQFSLLSYSGLWFLSRRTSIIRSRLDQWFFRGEGIWSVQTTGL